MQVYDATFARAYDSRWNRFAREVAPLIRNFYETMAICQENRTILDLCCGTGQLSLSFLEAAYRVVGIDSSEHMLACANESACRFLEAGKVMFIRSDARSFVLDEKFGLVVSTFDALNHLEDEQALGDCFSCVFKVLSAGGAFIFDLNTRLGLRRWNSMEVDDANEDLLVIRRGIYDGVGDKAWTRITGFVRQAEGYRRFDQTIFNTVFNLDRVRGALLAAGWAEVYFARVQDLQQPLVEPEKEKRVFAVALK